MIFHFSSRGCDFINHENRSLSSALQVVKYLLNLFSPFDFERTL